MNYTYITNHGLDPTTIPRDVKVSDARVITGGRVLFETNRPLTTKELDYYDIKDEQWTNSYIASRKALNQEMKGRR